MKPILPALALRAALDVTQHYDAFEVLEASLCVTNVHMEELLLWRLVQYMQQAFAFQPEQHAVEVVTIDVTDVIDVIDR